MIKLVIAGCCGKMGKRIATLATRDKALSVIGGIEAKGVSCADVSVAQSPKLIKDGDVLIDFSAPKATLEHLQLAVKHKTPVVIGTTGLDAQQLKKIKAAGSKIAVVFSPNMSLGVNLMFRLVQQAAEKLGLEYKVDIVEAHHIHKKDALSGTAKRLAKLINDASGRKTDKIDIGSIREGEIVGDHQVRFAGPQDTITIKHSAQTRDIFAQGALTAAKFVVKQKPGLYDMQDVIEKKGRSK